MATSKARRQVDVMEDILAELRLANRIEALKLGGSVLDHDPGTAAKTDVTRRRIARKNKLTADIRAALGIEEES